MPRGPCARLHDRSACVGGGLLVDYNIVISHYCVCPPRTERQPVCARRGKGFVFSVVKKTVRQTKVSTISIRHSWHVDQTQLTFYACIRQTRGLHGVCISFRRIFRVRKRRRREPGGHRRTAKTDRVERRKKRFSYTRN